MSDKIPDHIRNHPSMRALEDELNERRVYKTWKMDRQLKAQGVSDDERYDKVGDYGLERMKIKDMIFEQACKNMMKWEEKTFGKRDSKGKGKEWE